MSTGHAVVIGGSIAGLLAARVLADHYQQVTVIERDHFPTEPVGRKGVPQAHHVHVLLWAGQVYLETLFPGFQAELAQAGAEGMDWLADSSWYTYGGWSPRFQSGHFSHPCSRDLLEWSIRQRLLSKAAVQFLQDSEVVELLANADRTQVMGVRLRSRDPSVSELQNIPADLVVDASGRDTKTPHWLEELGYAPPAETVINSFLGYASRVYRKPAGANSWHTLLIRGTPPASKRGGVITTVEGERWMVTLAGAGRDYPPVDEAGFLDFARSLPAPTLYEAIQNAEPLSPIAGYRKTENRWRHYERLARWPEGLLVVGDAVCAFNPVYGQGMTGAALGAKALAECLRNRKPAESGDGFGLVFQKKLAGVVAAPWLLATGDDYRYLETEGGQRTAVTRLVHRYMDHVLALSNHDSALFGLVFDVLQLVKPASVLFGPGTLWKVMKSLVRPGMNL